MSVMQRTRTKTTSSVTAPPRPSSRSAPNCVPKWTLSSEPSYPTSPVPSRQFACTIQAISSPAPPGWHEHLDRSMARLDNGLHWRRSAIRALPLIYGLTCSEKGLTEVGKCYCYATSAINNARSATRPSERPQPLHTQSLQDMHVPRVYHVFSNQP